MFIEHQIVDMDESMIQRCIICGEVICNNNGLMYLKEFGPPKGFSAGSIFVSEDKSTISSIPFKNVLSKRCK